MHAHATISTSFTLNIMWSCSWHVCLGEWSLPCGHRHFYFGWGKIKPKTISVILPSCSLTIKACHTTLQWSNFKNNVTQSTSFSHHLGCIFKTWHTGYGKYGGQLGRIVYICLCYCMRALVKEGVWLFSAGAKDDVHTRVGENRPTHVSHFESKGSVLERLLHLSCNTRGVC